MKTGTTLVTASCGPAPQKGGEPAAAPTEVATQPQPVIGTIPPLRHPMLLCSLPKESPFLSRPRRNNLLLLPNRLRKSQTTLFGSVWPCFWL